MRDAENTPRAQFPANDRSRRIGAGPAGEAEGPVGGLPVNERPYRRIAEPVEVVRTLRRPVEQGRDDEEPGYVIHLPIRVPDLASATTLASRVAVSLGFLPELDAGETTVSKADDQNNRHRVFCDLLLPDRSRCPQRYEHSGPCGELPAAPEQRPAPGPSAGP
ncbi:hypothetical protein [Micromonospora globbae]|jgi:hypothetical protein|uniref:Uncharacterized protein n=1 Tax=Micromonospora globbae TaxID=1894969 RepID=A0A420EYL6_9ACTN|nr:hypothetical protein [Micromonospora globbae]RKF25811.1 hypothetical protein D7I43_18675 [Micromonospora globbae]WTF85990.1 hypothetical protein OH732_30815 [Micromonospora globbae]